MTRGTILIGAALAVAPVASIAADISATDNILVTATRTEIAASDATIPVTVISRDEIELSLATDLSELLRFEAGLDIGRNGGPGQATSLFLRGTESNHTLVLIDGVRINPGTIGGAALQHMAPEVIDRVEIVKGARSALYGSDAIGGVINVITRRADSSFAEGGVGFGSFDSISGNFAAGMKRENTDFGITLNYADTEGYPPRVESDINRGYENFSANLYAAHRFGEHEASIRHWHADGIVEYLDFFLSPVDQDFRNTATALQLDSSLGESGLSQLILSTMTDEIRQNQSPDFVESNRISLDWQYNHSFENHTLTGGIYLMEESAKAESFGSGFDEDTRVSAVFLQDQARLGRHRTFLAARLTDHETFGNQVTWNAEYAFDVSAAWTLTAGLGRAFRAPDASDRYGFGGNVDLSPEVSNQGQAGIRFRPGSRHTLTLELFANRIDDLIDFDFTTFTLQNIAEAEIRGAEIAWEYTGEKSTLRTALLSQRAEDRATGNRLLRRADESLTLSYRRNIGRHRVGFSALVTGDREDFGGVTLDSYALFNLTAEFALGSNLTLNARIENLTDEEYQTAANFRMQERSGFLELRYRQR
jgi:vitamin B12 transporter